MFWDNVPVLKILREVKSIQALRSRWGMDLVFKVRIEGRIQAGVRSAKIGQSGNSTISIRS
jgi:hypothetical protein